MNGTYTQRYNGLYPSDGQVFGGRYQAILVDADSYLLQLASAKEATFNEPRSVAVYLKRQLRGKSMAEICREYELKAQCSASRALERARSQMIKDRSFGKRADKLRRF